MRLSEKDGGLVIKAETLGSVDRRAAWRVLEKRAGLSE